MEYLAGKNKGGCGSDYDCYGASDQDSSEVFQEAHESETLFDAG